MSVLSQPQFHDEIEAFKFLESVVWADGTTCPHCGVVGGRVYDLSGVRGKPSKKSPKGAIRYGLKKCGECRQQFTAKVGTVFEHARLPLHKMLQAVHLMTSSKKGISAHQLHRILEVQYKSAWFLAHRIREAMREGELAPFGSGGGIVEADETFIGVEPHVRSGEFGAGKRGSHGKMKVLALVDRETGRSKTFVVDYVAADVVLPILQDNIAREAKLVTDDHGVYRRARKLFSSHDAVNHGKHEYGRGIIHTNTIEGFFSIFKRGMRGVYQHCQKKHLHRYAGEFSFRYSYREAVGVNDEARSIAALKGIGGKRLMYRQPKGA
jgi:transposase-like protein